MAEKPNLNVEERFNKLEKAKGISQTPGSKIQRVAHHLRDREHFAKHYSPKLVSFGPIHYGDPKLKLGEEYKLMWAAKYIESYDGETPQTLHKTIEDEYMKELKELFGKDVFTNDLFCNYSIQGFKSMEEMICWMLFVDGCALLHILEYAKLDQPDQMNAKVDQLVLVMQDVLLLENQLPYPLLKLLWRDTNEALLEKMKEFLHCHHWANKGKHNQIRVTEFPSPTHLLDLQRKIIMYENNHSPIQTRAAAGFCARSLRELCNYGCNQNQSNSEENKEDKVTYRNIQELKAAGIVLRTSHTRRPRDISFSHGWLCSVLTLPEIVVDDTTATTVLNLIAYEMCPDFANDYGICSYVSFLDSLIDHPEDVKALRKDKILLNSLGSDKEVAKLFNIIGTDIVPDMGEYSHLRAKIERHYKNKCKTWITLCYHTYFSNPWAIIAFLAAVLGLALTFIQTWFTIHPRK